MYDVGRLSFDALRRCRSLDDLPNEAQVVVQYWDATTNTVCRRRGWNNGRLVVTRTLHDLKFHHVSELAGRLQFRVEPLGVPRHADPRRGLLPFLRVG